MEGIVFNKDKGHLNLSWESYALRTAICLFDGATCLGPTVYHILYEDIASKLNLDNKIRIIIGHSKNEALIAKLQDSLRLLKFLRKRKHLKKQDIVTLRIMEKSVEPMYRLGVEDTVNGMKKFGLPQLAPFHFAENKRLGMWYVHPEQGEKEKQAELSRVLQFKIEDDEDSSPDVFIFYERLAQEVLNTHALTPLAVLPNLNLLETDKLQNACDRLKPQQEELKTLLPQMNADEHGNRYYAGTWNLEGVKAFAPKLQEALNAVPELEWAAKLHTELQTELHVGNMDTTELWQLLRNNGFIPDDTWKVLEKQRKKGIHCPTTAIMTITSNSDTNAVANMSEEETLVHKRKTIDLD